MHKPKTISCTDLKYKPNYVQYIYFITYDKKRVQRIFIQAKYDSTDMLSNYVVQHGKLYANIFSYTNNIRIFVV